MTDAQAVIGMYFDAFNRGDIEAMLDCLATDVVHHVNEGQVRVGKIRFAEFCAHMSRCYREDLTDRVVFASEDGTRGAAEYIVTGTYLQTDARLPEARGQTYALQAGSFLYAEGREDHPHHDLLQPCRLAPAGLVKVERLEGAALDATLADLARLRIAVFRDWPYLYDGDAAYEAHYLRSYRANPRAALVVVRAGDGRTVGAATGMPITDHADASQMTGPLPPLEDVFYCAESVLLPEVRGRGLGHALFDAREAIARQAGFGHWLFCAVVRPEDHPLRPQGYVPLDGFWRRRGYEKLPGAVAHFSWKDVDRPQETRKALQLWMRRLP